MLAEYIYLECFATPSRQAGHCRVETLRDENANYISLIAHRLHELLFAGVPLGFGCRETIHNLLVVNENDINLGNDDRVRIELGGNKNRLDPCCLESMDSQSSQHEKNCLIYNKVFSHSKEKGQKGGFPLALVV